jgi:hypothetical protein
MEFYGKLGFTEGGRHTPEGASEPSWVWLTSGGAQIMLTRASEPVDPEKQAVLFYLYCDDVIAFRGRLLEAGIEAGPVQYPFSRAAEASRVSGVIHQDWSPRRRGTDALLLAGLVLQARTPPRARPRRPRWYALSIRREFRLIKGVPDVPSQQPERCREHRAGLVSQPARGALRVRATGSTSAARE